MNFYSPKYNVDSDNVVKSLKEHILTDGMPILLDLENSNGTKLRDKNTNKDYLDFFTCFASMPIGYNHPKLNDPAFINYIGKVALNKPSNSDLYTQEYATFVNTFFKIAVPKEFKYGFFIDGGALAVENALKTAFDWKVRKNFEKGYKEEKGHKVIYLNEAFHGRSGYTMSLTNTVPEKVMYFPKFDWIKVNNPKIEFPLNQENIDDLIKREQDSLNQIKLAFKSFKDDIACIILEPIQGEGGDNHFRSEYLQELKSLCLENDAMLIFDEVQTGVGITGSWWAFQQLDVLPDIIAFGKKMQTCGILVGNRIDEVKENVFHTSSRINSTWGGNLVDMVRITKYLEIIEEENLVENAKIQGEYLLNKLKNIKSKKITNIRGRGLFVAFDVNPDFRKELLSNFMQNGLILLACGKKSIRFRPPLNVSKSEIDEAISIISKCLN
jgi:L-lysine 6-transaminase